MSKTASIRVIGAPQRIRDASRQDSRRSDSLRSETFRRALVPPSRQHGIRIFDPSSDWLFQGWKAGVYASDRSPCELSLLDRCHTSVTVPYDRSELTEFDFEKSSTSAVYGGLLFRHFGHFLLESTTRLWWPLTEDFDGPIVFHTVGRQADMPPFAERFFKLLGLRDRIILTGSRAFQFESVIVPERSFAIRKYWHEMFKVPFDRIGRHVERTWRPTSRIGEQGVYLSRTEYDFRRSIGEKKLERVFRRNGYAIAHPETLPLEEQVLLARRHVAMAGIQGSALHNVLFSESPRTAIYISRDYDINENFFMIDAMMDNNATYIYSGQARDALSMRAERALIAQQYKEDVALDLEKIMWALAQLGIQSS